jgi:predicted DNA-binding transcriptional regulator AlpA
VSTKSKKRRTQPHRPRSFHLDKRAPGLITAAPPDGSMLTTIQLAAWLGVSCTWLEGARVRGDGPPCERLTPRLIRYDVDKVKAWLARRAAAEVAS